MRRLHAWWNSLPQLTAFGYVLGLVLPIVGFVIGIGMLFRDDDDAINVIGVSLIGAALWAAALYA